MKAKDVQQDLKKVSNKEKAELLQRFFKTGPGQYGEGDIFRGVMVPAQRQLAKKYIDLSLVETVQLLQSKYHEDRLTALIILTLKYKNGTPAEQKEIFNIYISNTHSINNWDLVDVTVGRIVGHYIRENGGDTLEQFSKSKSLWERRIAIVATSHFIGHNEFDKTLKISKTLLRDKEDLIHKACGWMLREVGKRDVAILEDFLEEHLKEMPRTMLRYAIEKFPEKKRLRYLDSDL